ncbi:MAG: helix-turn-helix domain-containing protein [Firmicutes bacterium]|nr:helix-turn-helix domain-containing protein [Bacillota bacterium]
MPYFKIDNDIFSLRLDSYEFQIYAYLVSCAGKKGECWPSTNTIARMLGMSQSTVIFKIDSLVRRQLIARCSGRGRKRAVALRVAPCGDSAFSRPQY